MLKMILVKLNRNHLFTLFLKIPPQGIPDHLPLRAHVGMIVLYCLIRLFKAAASSTERCPVIIQQGERNRQIVRARGCQVNTWKIVYQQQQRGMHTLKGAAPTLAAVFQLVPQLFLGKFHFISQKTKRLEWNMKP